MGSLGITCSAKVLACGMSHQCIRDRLDFLEILQSGDTSIQELNCVPRKYPFSPQTRLCARPLGAVMVPFYCGVIVSGQ